MMKYTALLGSTGSIGTQTLEVIDEFNKEFSVEILSTHSNFELLRKQIIKYNPKVVFVTEKKCYEKLISFNIEGTKIYFGFSELPQVLNNYKIDICIGGISGAAGIEPTLKFLEKGITVALANKETLVTAGILVRNIINENGAKIITVDSEHSAIMQCLENTKAARRILLTASGGPFREWAEEDLQKVTLEDALNHPTWTMGKKITIDSATLMNKGLEVIEANWLFNIDYDNIEVIIHPESIVHSMVEYGDGSIIAHLGPKDMRIPIQYALTYPERINNSFPKIDLTEIGKLNFYKPDFKKFPSLALAYEAGRIGGTMPAVLNAANEVAVEMFLNKKISFVQIPQIVEKVMSEHNPEFYPDLNEIIRIDSWARNKAGEIK
ncbi:MAG: 1-deoxy-D-xylulose-5-phosphate reductoisomerase [Eubacteriales bacterium]|nr:1-deoxy-D-xylulose-5-phosphate reductoisomerase [Eubacteriales bacterium]